MSPAEKFLVGTSFTQLVEDRGLGAAFTWHFWIALAFAWVIGAVLRNLFYFLWRSFARIRYPQLDDALPVVAELSVRDGVFAWGGLHLHMTPTQALSEIGYEGVGRIERFRNGGTRALYGRYRDRDVTMFWVERAASAAAAEIAVLLEQDESRLGAGMCVARIHQRFPALEAVRDELWLHAEEGSVLHLPEYESKASLHLIRAESRERRWKDDDDATEEGETSLSAAP